VKTAVRMAEKLAGKKVAWKVGQSADDLVEKLADKKVVW